MTTRENKTYMVHQFDTDLILVSEVEFLYLDEYTDDLIHELNDVTLNIIKVQRPVDAYQLKTRSWDAAPVIWERKEKEKAPLLSEAEYYILKNLNTKWKWIARDEDGRLFLYKNKPDRVAALPGLFYKEILLFLLFSLRQSTACNTFNPNSG